MKKTSLKGTAILLSECKRLMDMHKLVIILTLAVAPLTSRAQLYTYITDYDLDLYFGRDEIMIPESLRKSVREDAVTYYPWLYSPPYLISHDDDKLAPTYCFGRDGDRYYFVLSLKDPGRFPEADIKSAPFLNVLCSDSSVHTFRLDSVTPLIESVWYYATNISGRQLFYTVIPNETEMDAVLSVSRTASSNALAQFHLDIVFDISNIDSFLDMRPVKFDFLGGQYVYDFTDNPKFIRRFAKGMRQSRKKLDKVYDLYHKGRSKLY